VSDDQNVMPRLSSAGRTKNNGNDARMSQKILCESFATASTLPVSVYSQTKTRSDVTGKDASIAPQNELRRPISETVMTRATVIKIFCCVLPHNLPWYLTLELSGAGGVRLERIVRPQPTRQIRA